jgi:hypothetical protein
MTGLPPAALLILLLATVYGAMAHLLWGRRLLQLFLFWVAAFAGCLLAYSLGLHLLRQLRAPAGVPIVEATALTWLLLFVASRLRI